MAKSDLWVRGRHMLIPKWLQTPYGYGESPNANFFVSLQDSPYGYGDCVFSHQFSHALKNIFFCPSERIFSCIRRNIPFYHTIAMLAYGIISFACIHHHSPSRYLLGVILQYLFCYPIYLFCRSEQIELTYEASELSKHTIPPYWCKASNSI